MASAVSDPKRVAKNTLFLYFRMFLIIGVTIFTTRIALEALGEMDYGVYNVIAGFVAMFGVVSLALSAAVSRYLNIEMGKESGNLQKVFSAAVIIHLLLGLIVLVVAETIAPWFLNHKMTIPRDSLYAANWVLQCSIVTFIIQLVSIPYNACIIAHEDMKVYAYISILEVLLKLGVVYVLLLSSERLMLYGLLLMGVAIIVRVIYQVYCHRRYEESHVKWELDRKLIKEMFGYASWNALGSTSVIFADQGVNVLINIFCSPIANAARGLAMQVNNAVNSFSQNFMVALNPQITKSYGAQEIETFKSLMVKGQKFAFSLLALLSVPIIVEAGFITHIWLTEVPEYTVTFIQLILVFTLSETMSNTLTTGLLAIGRLKKLMLTVAVIRLLNFPVSYLCLWLGMTPWITVVIAIAMSQIALLFRLFLLREYIGFRIFAFYKDSVFPEIFVLVVTFACCMVLQRSIDESVIRLLLVSIVSVVFVIAGSLYLVCNKNERKFILDQVAKIKKKFLKR